MRPGKSLWVYELNQLLFPFNNQSMIIFQVHRLSSHRKERGSRNLETAELQAGTFAKAATEEGSGESNDPSYLGEIGAAAPAACAA